MYYMVDPMAHVALAFNTIEAATTEDQQFGFHVGEASKDTYVATRIPAGFDIVPGHWTD
jgi:hypothetical protein